MAVRNTRWEDNRTQEWPERQTSKRFHQKTALDTPPPPLNQHAMPQQVYQHVHSGLRKPLLEEQGNISRLCPGLIPVMAYAAR